MPPPTATLTSRLFLGPALRAQPDRRLVTLVREGYESAFEEIVRRYGRPLARYAAAIAGSRGEDVTQDALSKALLALRRNEAEIELRPWLFRIVRNTALNELRDSPPAPELLAEAIAGGESPAEALERREELTDLMRRLQSLPEPQRAAIVMREMEGLSHAEIAAALGVSGGAARQAIHRARQALREGAAILLPLPLLRLLFGLGSDAATAGAGAGGTAVAGSTIGGAGAGAALKAGVVTAVLAGSVGTGIALHEQGHKAGAPGAGAESPPAVPVVGAALATGARGAGTEASSGHGGPDRAGDRGSGKRHGSPDRDRGHRGQLASQRSLASAGEGLDDPSSPTGQQQGRQPNGQRRHGDGHGEEHHSGRGEGRSGHVDESEGPHSAADPSAGKGQNEQHHGGGHGGERDNSGQGSGHSGKGRGNPGDSPAPTEVAPAPLPPAEGTPGNHSGSGPGEPESSSNSGSSGSDERRDEEELP